MNSLTGNIGTTGSGTESQLLGVDKNLIDITWSRDDFFNENKSIVFQDGSMKNIAQAY